LLIAMLHRLWEHGEHPTSHCCDRSEAWCLIPSTASTVTPHCPSTPMCAPRVISPLGLPDGARE